MCPTSENKNKKRIRFACKHDGCLFSLLFVCSVKDGGDFVIRKYMDHSLDCPKLSPNMLIINKKSRYIYTKHRKEIEEHKKTREKTEALQSVGLTVSPHTLNRIQRLKSSPSCHQDEGCSMLRNLFEFVTNDTHDEMNSCSGGVSIIEKDSEDRLVRAFLEPPPVCCTTAKNFLLPQIVLDRGHSPEAVEEGTFLTACMQDGNTETIVVSIAFVPSEAKEHWSWFCNNNLKQALSLDWEAVTFISDRGTGLVPALSEVFPENEHRHCVVHTLAGTLWVVQSEGSCSPCVQCSKENHKRRV